MATPTSLGSVDTNVPASGNAEIDALIDGLRWDTGYPGVTQLTYSFPTAGSVWSQDPVTGYDVPSSGYEPWDRRYGTLDFFQKSAAAGALQSWAAVANLQLTEVPDDAASAGDIRFAFTTEDPGTDAYAYLPGATSYGADIWLNARDPTNDLPYLGSYGYSTLVHEIGHALGLKHPFEDGDTGVTLPGGKDWIGMTIMAYHSYPGLAGAQMSVYPTTPMMLDIQALQHLYGAPAADSTSNLYQFFQGQDYYQTIWDSGGHDTIWWHGGTQGALIDLTPGHWSDLGNPVLYSYDNFATIERTQAETVAIYKTVIIEDAIGGRGADTLIGNSAGNLLAGGGGNDTLRGGTGADDFTFDKALAANLDTILDFRHGQHDRIWLDNDVFKKLGSSAATLNLKGAYFSGDGVAHDSNDYILYDAATGTLSYDSDGSGGGAAPIAFAVLGTTTHPALLASDIQVIG